MKRVFYDVQNDVTRRDEGRESRGEVEGERTRLKVYRPSSLSHTEGPLPFLCALFALIRRGYRRNDARNLLYTRCTYRRYRKKTCPGLHRRAQVGGVGKQRVLSRAKVLSLENCSTNLIATRESRYSRANTRDRAASKQRRMSACEKIVSGTIPA